MSFLDSKREEHVAEMVPLSNGKHRSIFFLLNIMKFVAEQIGSKIRNHFFWGVLSFTFFLYINFLFKLGELTKKHIKQNNEPDRNAIGTNRSNLVTSNSLVFRGILK